MSSDITIRVENLSKAYKLYQNPVDRLKESIHPFRKKYHRNFYALKNINFEVKRGESIGVIGKNGSGKSTLLKILTGVLTPTSGAVSVHGRVSALLELGMGFNPEMSGIENVYFSGTIMGYSKKQMDSKMDDILSFADIGEFANQPVKTYSSGMFMRLGFAVQAQVDPDILIIDEALAVGDAKFQAKCFERIKRLKANGTSILLVTHSSEQVVTHCTKAILLDQGQILLEAKPLDAVNRYLDLLFGKNSSRRPIKSENFLDRSNESCQYETPNVHLNVEDDIFAQRSGYNTYEYRWGDGAASITDYCLISDGKEYPAHIRNGADVRLSIAVRFHRRLVRPILGVTIKTKEGVTVYATNSELLHCTDFGQVVEPNEKIIGIVSFCCSLAQGDYFISLGIATREGEDIIPRDRRYDAIHFVVNGCPDFFGLVNLRLSMEMRRI